MSDNLKIQFINYDEYKPYFNINYKFYNNKDEYINKIINDIKDNLEKINNLNLNKNYKKYYLELIKLLEKIKPNNVYGQSASFLLDKIKTLENNFKNFDEIETSKYIKDIISLNNEIENLGKELSKESTNKFINFNTNISKLNNFLNEYEKIKQSFNNLNNHLYTLLNIKKYNKDQIKEFNEIKENFSLVSKDYTGFTSLYNINDLIKLSTNIYKEWIFDNNKMGIGIKSQILTNKIDNINNLLNKLQFTNQNINDYSKLLEESNEIQNNITKIENDFLSENLNKTIRTDKNKSIITQIQQINKKMLDTNITNITNNIKIINDKIEKQSKSIFSSFKKGKGLEEDNILYIIFIGILLVLIFIVENYHNIIPIYVTIISAIIGSLTILYGIYKLVKYKIYIKNTSTI